MVAGLGVTVKGRVADYSMRFVFRHTGIPGIKRGTHT
jgi:hypothetical protein